MSNPSRKIPLEEVSCPCGSPVRSEIAFHTLTRCYRRCPACDLIFYSPRPIGAVITEFYRETYEETYGKLERGPNRMPVFLHALKHLSRYCRPPGRLVDIGCGDGEFLTLCRARGWSCFGVELSRAAAAQAARRGITMLTNEWLDGSPYSGAQSDRYDVITLINVLDAMLDPAAVLRRIGEVLAPDGLVLIRVPNGAFHVPLRRPVAWVGGQGQQAFQRFIYTPQSLERHLRAVGLKPISIRNSRTSYGPVSSSERLLRRLAWRVGAAGLWGAAQTAYWLTGGRVILAPSFEVIAGRAEGTR